MPSCGHRPDLFDRFVAAAGHRVGGAERPGLVEAIGVVSGDDDALGAETVGGQHGAEADRAVGDDRTGR